MRSRVAGAIGLSAYRIHEKGRKVKTRPARAKRGTSPYHIGDAVLNAWRIPKDVLNAPDLSVDGGLYAKENAKVPAETLAAMFHRGEADSYVQRDGTVSQEVA